MLIIRSIPPATPGEPTINERVVLTAIVEFIEGTGMSNLLQRIVLEARRRGTNISKRQVSRLLSTYRALEPQILALDPSGPGGRPTVQDAQVVAGNAFTVSAAYLDALKDRGAWAVEEP